VVEAMTMQSDAVCLPKYAHEEVVWNRGSHHMVQSEHACVPVGGGPRFVDPWLQPPAGLDWVMGWHRSLLLQHQPFMLGMLM
jgi:hypothetical protein